MAKKTIKETKKVATSITKKETDPEAPVYIVGIGASAGGLEALEQFFGSCPADSGLAFVIVQHLSPDYKSLMTELLSRYTQMVVKEAENDEVVLVNKIYLIPRNKNLTISDGKLKLSDRPAKTQINFSIDIFFQSLAHEQKERAIGIILSGTGSDGTRGGKLIKELGGTIFVQNPDSGRFDGMTRSAINHGLADYILFPEEMPTELIQFVSHPHFEKLMMTGTELGKDIEAMDRVLKIIKNHTGYDFFAYKKPTLLRRTAKRMNITKCDTIENYIDYLYQNAEEKNILIEDFLIGVTKFFRDTEAYNVIERQVIPNIVNAKKDQSQPIKLWVVACSTGEEAYSIAILLEEHLERNNLHLKYKLFATDIDGKAIDIAAKGFFAQNISLDISAQRLTKYFIKKDDGFQIIPNIRKNIIFSKHDILKNPPFNKMDLVSCRNMLIYIDNPMQAKIMHSLHYSLNLDGYLFMGSSESIGVLKKNFTEVNSKWKIYQNVHPAKMTSIAGQTTTWQPSRNSLTPVLRNSFATTVEDKSAKLINATLMEEYDVVSVCVDKSFEIIHASGKFKKYVIIPETGYSNNIQKILPDQLNIPISTGIRKLMNNNKEVITKNIKLVVDDKMKHLKIMIQCINMVISQPTSFLITILEKYERTLTSVEQSDSLLATSPANTVLFEEIGELKEALSETRENLQATIEELETSNEEMQATNEELLASNEELQSTNEELQSLNEELHTVNAELQEKNSLLLELNSDIENLMININIGTIFLDNNLEIRKFTPSIKEHFQLRDEDIGRQIEHFSGNIGPINLVNECHKVLKDLSSFRTEFQNPAGVWFMLQIFPYRNQNNKINGVVVNFIDIDDLKRASFEKEKLDSRISYMVQTSPLVMFIKNVQNFKVELTTGSVYEDAGYSNEEIAALSYEEIKQIGHKDDQPKMDERLKGLKKLKDGETQTFESRLIHKTTGESIWFITTEKVNERDADGEVLTTIGISQNITNIKSLSTQLEASEKRSNLAIQSTGAGLWEWSDVMEDDAWWSDQFYKLLGYSPEKLPASFAVMLHLIHPDDVEHFQEELNAHLTKKKRLKVTLRMKTRMNEYKWYSVTMQAQWDQNDKPEKVVGTLVDINEQHTLRATIKEKQERLEAVYDAVPGGILTINKDGEIVEASKGIKSIVGYSEEEIVGKKILDITYEEDKKTTAQFMRKIAEDDKIFESRDKRYIHKDGRIIWCNLKNSSIVVDGEIFYIGMVTNINERKAQEEKMKQMNVELERFAYLASHDLKEPLRTISSLTERFSDKYNDTLDAGAKKYVKYIEDAANRMEVLTSELLVYSEISQKIGKTQEINLDELLEQTKKNLESSITENKALFEVTKLPSISGNPTQIELLFQNLISNSLKYRNEVAPKIVIDCKDKVDHWEFSVADNGIGIDKKYHEKVFEVFKRLHSKNEYMGTGIGLSNCKRIVDNHGGTIWVQSTLGQGATFYFTIPKKLTK